MKRRGFIGSLIGCFGIPFIPKESKPRMYEMEIKSVKIVGTRKLKAKWTNDMEKDLMNMIRIDIQKEIDRELIKEIDRELINKMG